MSKPEHGLVVIESGPFAGWVGEYDDDEDRKHIVYPHHPLNVAPYVLVSKIRELTSAEREAYERGERAVAEAIKERLANGGYAPGFSGGDTGLVMYEAVEREVAAEKSTPPR